MKRKSSVVGRLLSDFNRLIPFVGFIFVVAGILGLVFVQKPLDQSQELRSDASEDAVAWPSITAANPSQNFYIDESSQISLNLNATNIETKSVNVVFNIINSDIETPTISINAGSGLRAETVEVEEVDDGYLVSLKAIPNNIVWDPQPSDTSFIKINFTASAKGTISINFDEDNTYLETSTLTYAIDDQTINFDIKARQDDASDDTEIKQCNETCDSNANCEVGKRCFDTGSGKKCRLATNSSSSNCSSAPDLGPNKQCDEYCANSGECAQGFSCWFNSCRNPSNVESTTCSDLTQTQQTTQVSSCGESCSSNADCAINLRCFNSECRLATNPSSLTCSAATEKTVSTIYEEDEDESTDSALPIKKGDNLIPDEPIGEINVGINEQLPEIVPVDETALDLLIKMLKDKQQNLPTSIILAGIGLLVASLTVFLIAKLISKTKKPNTMTPISSDRIDVDSHEVSPGNTPITTTTNTPAAAQPATPTTTSPTTPTTPQNEKIKKLLNKLNETPKDQNQG